MGRGLRGGSIRAILRLFPQSRQTQQATTECFTRANACCNSSFQQRGIGGRQYAFVADPLQADDVAVLAGFENVTGRHDSRFDIETLPLAVPDQPCQLRFFRSQTIPFSLTRHRGIGQQTEAVSLLWQ